jgi:carbonic anhydrase/acetyltransferase-like protein (isoleucine patch superfamily)
MIEAYGTLRPNVDPTAFVHPSAQLLGDVTLRAHASVWPGCVLRGDQGAIVIGEETNIQDLTVVHATGGISTVTIGARVTVGHRVILHGCTVGDDCLVGMGSILLDNCVIEPDSIVGAGSLVPPGMVVPSGHLVMGSPARVVRPLRDGDRRMIRTGRAAYLQMAATYRAQEGTP